MGWTQAMCRTCWDVREPNREPHLLNTPEMEVCCICGQDTTDGIYVRIDPTTVPYPSRGD